MIETFEIPTERWKTFIQLINQRTRERPVRIEAQHPAQGSQGMGPLLLLLGLELETRDSGRSDLLISVENGRGQVVDHHLDHPVRLELGHDEAGEMEFLAVEAPGGARTVIHFQHQPVFHARVAPGVEQAVYV